MRLRNVQLLAICLLMLHNAPIGANEAKPEKPNVVFLLADDLGYGDLSCYGCPDIRTPNIDSLAKQGVRWTSFYANGPECTPTRTALMTGRYQQRVGGLECAIGVRNVGRYDDAIRLAKIHELGLPVEEVSLARRLKDAGYATRLYGKWHLGYETKFIPNRHGFDHALYVQGGGVDYFFHCEDPDYHTLRLNGKTIRRDGNYMTDLITEGAVKFLQSHKKGPFFLYVPFTAPHVPLQGPMDKPEKPVSFADWNVGTRKTYVKMVEHLDHSLGKILRTLEKKGFAKNTLVVFASDNGGTRKGRNAPYSGYKGTVWEGGIRVPCIARWPGKIRAGHVSDDVTIMMDWTVALTRIAGAKMPTDRPFDGIDLLRRLSSGEPKKRALFWRHRRGEKTHWAVRDGWMKYRRLRDGDQVTEHVFDLKNDPGEKKDLLEEMPGETARLKQLLAGWEKQVKPRR